jgi:hypothetical protein
MSVRVSEQVYRHSRARRGVRLVLLALADRADDAGVSYPGVNWLAKRTLMDPRSVQRSLRQLEHTLREIRVLEPGGGREKSTKYQITVPAVGNGDASAGVSAPGNHDAHAGVSTPPANNETLAFGAENPGVSSRKPRRSAARSVGSVQIRRDSDSASTMRDEAARVRRVTTGTPRRPAPETTWPEDFALTADLREYAIRRGCQNPDLGFDYFHNRKVAKDVRHRDWPAAFRAWMDNHGRFGCPCDATRAAVASASPPVPGVEETRRMMDTKLGRAR